MTEETGKRVATLGTGAWGTALAASLARKGHAVRMWGRNAEVVDAINNQHRNPAYLDGIELPAELRATTDDREALVDAELVLVAVPAQTLGTVMQQLGPQAPGNAVFISCAKGIDRESEATMAEIIAAQAGKDRAAVLSGPSFAVDVAAGLPTAVTVAAHDLDRASALSRSLSSRSLRCYASDDVRGVELGGAFKNVLAVAAGMVHGRGLGASALAALTARGFAELQRVALALGGRSETLVGLSGLGDLILTCSSEKSRNFAYGAALARGESMEQRKLAEGVYSASVAARMANEHGIDTPIVCAVDDILAGRLSVDEATDRLMSRPLKTEA